MPAKKGNKYYLNRTADGRTKNFESPADLWAAFVEYKNNCDVTPWLKNDVIRSGEHAGQLLHIPTQRPYTRQGFADYIGMSWQGVANYGEKESHKEYFEVFTRITQAIDTQQLEGAMVGAFNANIVARVQGLSEKTNTDITTQGDKIILTIGKDDAKL